MPTTDDMNRWQEHQNATKDEQGETWTGRIAGVLVLVIFFSSLVLCSIFGWMVFSL